LGPKGRSCSAWEKPSSAERKPPGSRDRPSVRRGISHGEQASSPGLDAWRTVRRARGGVRVHGAAVPGLRGIVQRFGERTTELGETLPHVRGNVPRAWAAASPVRGEPPEIRGNAARAGANPPALGAAAVHARADAAGIRGFVPDARGVGPSPARGHVKDASLQGALPPSLRFPGAGPLASHSSEGSTSPAARRRRSSSH
jgi:hypothetical protein